MMIIKINRFKQLCLCLINFDKNTRTFEATLEKEYLKSEILTSLIII